MGGGVDLATAGPVIALVSVYEWDDSAWIQVGTDIEGEVIGDRSGWSVSLSDTGERVVIGASRNPLDMTSGHVRVYHMDVDGTAWNQLGGDLDLEGEAADDYSGWSVSLSGDGERVAIGATYNDGNGSDSGHVRVYHLDGTAWTQLGDDMDGEAADDGSGYSVSLSNDGGRVAIGAPRNDGNGAASGHVRVYHLDGTAWIQLGADMDGEDDGDQLGYSVS